MHRHCANLDVQGRTRSYVISTPRLTPMTPRWWAKRGGTRPARMHITGRRRSAGLLAVVVLAALVGSCKSSRRQQVEDGQDGRSRKPGRARSRQPYAALALPTASTEQWSIKSCSSSVMPLRALRTPRIVKNGHDTTFSSRCQVWLALCEPGELRWACARV